MVKPVFRLVRHAYDLRVSESALLSNTAEAMTEGFDAGYGVLAMSYLRGGAGGKSAIVTRPEARGELAHVAYRFLEELEQDNGEHVLESLAGLHSTGRAASLLPERARRRLERLLELLGEACGAAEFFGAFVPGRNGSGLIAGAPCERPKGLGPAKERAWATAFAHLQAGISLRRAVNERTGPGRDGLRRLVRHHDMRESAEERIYHALDIYHGILDGSWVLADYFDTDTARFMIAVRMEQPLPRPLCPAPRERAALDLAAAGFTNKEIAIRMEVEDATAGVLVAGGQQKLAAFAEPSLPMPHVALRRQDASISEIELGTCLCAIGIAPLSLEWSRWDLTSSEAAVASFALKGVSNREIARLRGTSTSTVQNQIAAAFAKLGVRSRRELLQLWIQTPMASARSNRCGRAR